MEIVNALPFRWTAQRYMRFAETDIFVTEDHVELLNGVIVQAPQVSYRHATALARISKRLVLASEDRYDVHIRAPLLLDEWSVPEPDVCLVDSSLDALKRHPGPEHVHLLIEIAEATLAFDQNEKRRAYARQRIREYWILNLIGSVLEVHRNTEGGRYGEIHVYGMEEAVSPLAFPDLKLRVSEFIS